METSWIHAFPKCISSMWNTNSLNQDSNSGRQVDFLRRCLSSQNTTSDCLGDFNPWFWISKFSLSLPSCPTKAREPSLIYYLPMTKEKRWIHAFLGGISAPWNSDSHVCLGFDPGSPNPPSLNGWQLHHLTERVMHVNCARLS